MHVSAQGISFIAAQEGLRRRAYQDATGVWTIGYGHTAMAGEPHVHADMTITAEQAREILQHDLLKFEKEVLSEVHVPLAQHQFDALVSFTFNVGRGNLRNLVTRSGLNRGNYAGVPRHLEHYDLAGGHVLDALSRRRRAEARMFEGR